MATREPVAPRRAAVSRRARKDMHGSALNVAAQRLDSLRRVFPSDAAIAEALDMSRAALGRWRDGALPDPEVEARLIALDTVVSLLATYLEPSTIPKWLRGPDPFLGDRAPLDVLRRGHLVEVIQAIEADQAGVFA
ncbi:hypothetical protein BH23GEM3_BH23GEM3_26030 [soil metagenome]|jgi:uncharacterized protein (DUF2384 family)